MTGRYLIVNADDFGLTAGVDRGIERAVVAGAVTSVSVMANLAAPAAVVRLATLRAGLSIGAHLNLTTGRPVLPSAAVPSLVGADGRFHALGELGRRVVTGRVRATEAAAELAAQLGTLCRTGVAVDHLDSHEHVHLLPVVMGAVVRIARQSGVLRIRSHRPRLLPADGAAGEGALATYYMAHPRRLLTHAAKRLAAGHFRRLGLAGPDGMVAPSLLLGAPGATPLAAWRAIAGALPRGLWELVVHPADLDVPRTDEDEARLGGLVARRGAELDALVDPAFVDAIRTEGVTLASFTGMPLGPIVRGEETHARRRA